MTHPPPSPLPPGVAPAAVGPAAPAARSTLAVIFLTIFLDLIGFSIIFPLFPHMLEYYLGREGNAGLLGGLLGFLRELPGGGTEKQHLVVLFGGVLGSLYSLLQFLFAPFWGSLSDRTGRRPILLVTIAGLAASYLLWFLSGSFALLVAARLFGGMMAGNLSVATAAVADSTSPENRSRGMAVIGVAFGLGFILGPALGSALIRIDFLRWAPGLEAIGVNPFSGAAAGAFLLSAVNWLLVWKRFPETLPAAERGKARAGGRTINPVKLFRPAGLPGVTRANFIWFLYILAFSGMEFTLTFMAVDRFGFSPAENAYLFVFIGLIIAFVQGGPVRQMAPVYGEKALAIFGLAAILPGLIVTGLAARVGTLYLGLALMALGSAFVSPSLSALVSLYTPPDRQGSILGIFRSLGALGRAVGPLLACAVYWRFGSETPYLAGAALLLVPLGMAAGLPAPRKGEGAVA